VDWYACQRGATKRHVCETPAAVSVRESAERKARQDAQGRRVAWAAKRRRQRRNRRVGKTLAVVVAAALVTPWGYGEVQDLRRTPADPPMPFSPSGLVGQERQPPAAQPTAECMDGTLSYSANRRGTCSHHGGVAYWLE
jgi:hypothetical protein